MTIDEVNADDQRNPTSPQANQCPSSIPDTIYRESVEVWLHQIASSRPRSPILNRKRKRSESPTAQAGPSSSPHISEPTPSESSMDPPPSSSPNTCTPSTPSQSSKSATRSITQTPSGIVINQTTIHLPSDENWVKERLRTYKCYQDEPDTLEKYPKFHKQVLDIINGERLSQPSQDSAKKYKAVHNIVKSTNEDSFLINILPFICKEKRTVKKIKRTGYTLTASQAAQQLESLEATNALIPDVDTQRSHTHDAEIEADDGKVQQEFQAMLEGMAEETEQVNSGVTEEEVEEEVVEDFFAHGVLPQKGVDFRKTLLPQKPGEPPEDKKLAKAMAKYDGMTNPRPDWIYGTYLRKYPIPDDVEISAIVQFLIEIVPLVNFAWFIIEGKSHKGTRAQAENQVCRGGAVLVNAYRLLLDHIGGHEMAKGSRPDNRTFVFSAALCPALIEFRVHWAEIHENKNTIFHMHVLASEKVGDTAAVGKLRKIIHNILDWGCKARFEDTKKTWDKIYDYERKRVAAEGVSESGGDSTSSPKKRKRAAKS